MIILHQTERAAIVAKEDELMKGEHKMYAMYKNALYNVETCEPLQNGKYRLYGSIRDEIAAHVDVAKAKLEEVAPMFSKQAAPAASPVGSALEQMLCEVIAKQSVSQIVETVKPEIEKHIINTFGVLPQIHEVKTPAGTHEIKGTVHECFDKVLNLVNMDIPVFLTGAAGTGKNVICKQVAEAMGLNFYFTNAVTQEYQLKGFIDANGNYHETQFFKAFTEGGLFFLDEMDGSIPETLIILNAAIANRYFDFPTGKVEAHENFRVIAAGNTVGTGADIEYTGRFQLDAASLDRFALITIDYSPTIEKAVTNGNDELCTFAHTFRAATSKAGIRCLFTYRALERIAKLETVFGLAETLQIALTKGLRKDDINVIVAEMSKSAGAKASKYTKALTEIA